MPLLLTNQRAYSLLELLTTLCVMALVLGFASPSLATLLQQNRQTDSINQMHAHLNYAREKAISSRSVVSLCTGSNTCEDTRIWAKHILVFQDSNRNGQLDQGETLLKVATIDASHRWNWTNFRQQKHMAFKPNGTTDSLNGTFTLCETSRAIRTVVINITGRAKLETPVNSDKCRS
jgi:type IV fimbrial biogenesis protein FimT